jgi:hypothetical protein
MQNREYPSHTFGQVAGTQIQIDIKSNAQNTQERGRGYHSDVPSSGLVGYPSYPKFVNVEFLYQFIRSCFNVAPCALPFTSFTSLNHNQRKVLALRLESNIPKYILAPSIPPNEKQAANVLNPALTTPETSENGHAC